MKLPGYLQYTCSSLDTYSIHVAPWILTVYKNLPLCILLKVYMNFSLCILLKVYMYLSLILTVYMHLSLILTVYMHLSLIAGSGWRLGNVRATNSLSSLISSASLSLSTWSRVSGSQGTPQWCTIYKYLHVSVGGIECWPYSSDQQHSSHLQNPIGLVKNGERTRFCLFKQALMGREPQFAHKNNVHALIWCYLPAQALSFSVGSLWKHNFTSYMYVSRNAYTCSA